MVFIAGDKERIRKALNLHRDMGIQNSLLQTLMDELERFDSRESTDYVTQVRADLTTIETLDTTIQTQSVDDGKKIVDLDGRIRVEQFAGTASAASRNQRSLARSRVKSLLDPESKLDPYVMTGRIVPSI